MQTGTDTQTAPATERQMMALMTTMGMTAPPTDPQVMDLMQRRQEMLRMESAQTEAYCAECEDEAPTLILRPAPAETDDESPTLILRPVQVEPTAPAPILSPMPSPGPPMRELLAPQKLRGQPLRLFIGFWQMLWLLFQNVSQPFQRRWVPVLIQLTEVECGAACLAMILSYYGRPTTVAEVRERCGVGRDGLTALDVVKAARGYGLRVRAITLQENDFRLVSLPAIIHWQFNHYLIVERWSPQQVGLVDPAIGRRHVTGKEFDQSFTGVVIMLEPGSQFDRTAKKRAASLKSYALGYIKLAPFALAQVLAASLVLQLFGLIVPVLTALVVDQIIPLGLSDTLTFLALGLFILVLAQLVTTTLRAIALLYLQTRVDSQSMLNFIEQLLSLPQRFFQQRSSGDIVSRLTSNSIIRETVSNQLVTTVLDGSFVLVYLIILLFISTPFGLLVLGLALLQVILLVSTTRRLRDMTTRELVAQGKAQGYVVEALIGIATLKAAGAEQRTLERWTNVYFDQLNTSIPRSLISWLIDTLLTTLRTLSPLVLLVVGTIQVLHGTLPVGTMLALIALATAFLTPVASLVTSGQRLQLVRSHLERIADVLEAEPEQDPTTASEPPRLTGKVRLEGVTFQYDVRSPKVLQEISVSIRPGQKVAIVGRSGSGKSTLGNLLLGLYLPTEGEIYYDELPLRSLNYQAVRSQFGVVLQNATVFSGSIRENISLNNPGLSLERVIRAAQAAAIHDDILALPLEYETLVSEGGSAVSGGQRQRIALARALANDPVILLLDEATSALDVVTERIVEQNLRTLACTQIVIAHRLSTIRNADVILVLDKGRIVERGTHEELLQQDGFYAALIQSQLATGEIKAG